jgi:hypothetical protein
MEFEVSLFGCGFNGIVKVDDASIALLTALIMILSSAVLLSILVGFFFIGGV